MKRRIRYRAGRLLAVLAICLQAVLPGTLTVAHASGVDVSRFLCAPAGDALSSEIASAALRIAALAQDELPDQQSTGDHCALCTLAQGVPLPEVSSLSVPARFVLEDHFAGYEPGLIHKAQGPPLGSRGPPRHI